MIDGAATRVGRTLQLPDVLRVGAGAPLKQCGWACSPKEYGGFATAMVATAFLAVTVLANVFTRNAFTALFAGLLAAALSTIVLKGLPQRAAKKKAEELELFAPIALRTIASELESKASFEDALKSAADCGAFGRALSKARALTEKGHGYAKVFSHLSTRTTSMLVKRAFTQLYYTYSRGGSPEALRKLADEAIALQKQGMREHAAKTAFLGTVFIAVSAIVPAFFGAYAVISSSFLDATFSPQDIIIFFAVVFPLLDLSVLAHLKESTPKVLAIG